MNKINVWTWLVFVNLFVVLVIFIYYDSNNSIRLEDFSANENAEVSDAPLYLSYDYDRELQSPADQREVSFVLAQKYMCPLIWTNVSILVYEEYGGRGIFLLRNISVKDLRKKKMLVNGRRIECWEVIAEPTPEFEIVDFC